MAVPRRSGVRDREGEDSYGDKRENAAHDTPRYGSEGSASRNHKHRAQREGGQRLEITNTERSEMLGFLDLTPPNPQYAVV